MNFKSKLIRLHINSTLINQHSQINKYLVFVSINNIRNILRKPYYNVR